MNRGATLFGESGVPLMVIVVPNSTSLSYFKSDSFCAVSFASNEKRSANEIQRANVANASWLGKLVL